MWLFINDNGTVKETLVIYKYLSIFYEISE